MKIYHKSIPISFQKLCILTLPNGSFPLQQFIEGQNDALLADILDPFVDGFAPLFRSFPVHPEMIVAVPLASHASLHRSNPGEYLPRILLHQPLLDLCVPEQF